MSKTLYLDANAHLPMLPEAMRAFTDFHSNIAGHGHAMSPSLPGRQCSNAIEEARGKIAELLGATDPSQIIFTSTCSQACEWSMYLLSQTNFPAICSPVEHAAMKQAYEKHFDDNKYLNVDSSGEIQLNVQDIEFKNYDNHGVVCIQLQNEIGTIQPIDKIKCRYLVSDMSQSPGKIPVNLDASNVDIATFGAHKFGGPGGLGFFYVKDVSIWKEFGTGSRYFLDRTGTPDGASVVATAAALEVAVKTLPERAKLMEEFQTTLEAGLKELGLEVIGAGSNRAANTTFFKINNSMEVLSKLGAHNVHVGLGSACGAAHTGKSPLMLTLGREGGSNDFIRVSTWGEYGEKDAKQFLDVLAKVYTA